MLRLESKTLQREFVVHEEILYASQIRNVLSGRDFVPDGNSVEFAFHFTDGSEFSSKGLKVTGSEQEDGRLSFTFEETDGITPTLTFCTGEDGYTLKKQISFVQTGDKIIDYIALEYIGITNSKTHFSVPTDIEGSELSGVHSSLGQPFYIDTLFFGCEFPATMNIIEYGIGQVRLYLGKNFSGKFDCPFTVMGGAKSNLMTDIQKAFYNYIESIAAPTDFRVQYNSWYDHMLNINADNVEKSFYEIEKGLSSNGVEPIDAYVVDDGWNDYKASFWSFNKKFPNQMNDITVLSKKLGSSFGLWLGPRGGYNSQGKFAKRVEKASLGAYNAQADDICVADKSYCENVEKFIVKSTKEFDIGYWKFDGFCLSPCTAQNHNHITGGENNMYYFTEMWQNWIDIFKNIRQLRKKQGKSLWINMTCYVNPSPWWLQYVNSIWLQNSNDIGFAENIDEQSQADAEITYRDSRYYNLLCERALQLPLKHIYNHEPIYGSCAKVEYSDEEFEKYLYFNASRGQALNELYLSYSKMNKSKWRILANVLKWQKSNYDILQNAIFIGGNPEENNIYGYFSWDEKGNGIVSLRNPTDEKTSLTITLNKLMGCPEDLSDVKRYNVYNESGKESFDSYSYGDKIDFTLKPFEVKVLQFGHEDMRYDYVTGSTEFTVSFEYKGEENITVAENDDLRIAVEKGRITVRCGRCHLRSGTIISGNEHKITVVREKNRALKIYIDKFLDCSGFDPRAKSKINTVLKDSVPDIKVSEKATPYDEIVTLGETLKKVGKKRRK